MISNKTRSINKVNVLGEELSGKLESLPFKPFEVNFVKIAFE
jgi:hypothetical protein